MKMITGLITILALSPLVLGCAATTPAFRDETGRILPASVARMEYVELGGSRQWICVRGESVDKPLLLILHGGPGTPEVLPFRRYDAGLEKDFIVVNWDQRGSGKSYSPSMTADSLTIEQILSDAHELVGYLKESFGKEKIYLLGHSWGTILGALLASRYPEDFHAYIGMGQWVSTGRQREALLRVHAKRGRAARGQEVRRAARADRRAGERPLPRRLAREPARPAQVPEEVRRIPLRQERRPRPAFRFLPVERRNTVASASQPISRPSCSACAPCGPRWRRSTCPGTRRNIGTPVFLFLGRHDWNTPPSLAEAWLSGISAPSKRILWFEDSAHCPSFEEPDKFMTALARISHNEPLSE